ncbi:MAG: glutaminase [Jiangellaceae bacterium]
MPAKCGVSGGIAALSPAPFGIGVDSPPLDGWGTAHVASC